MGRKKIKIEKILEEKVRISTFYKRKRGLVKKAIELSTLCNVHVLLCIYDPQSNKFVKYYGGSRFQNKIPVIANEFEMYTNEDYNKICEKNDFMPTIISKKHLLNPKENQNIQIENLLDQKKCSPPLKKCLQEDLKINHLGLKIEIPQKNIFLTTYAPKNAITTSQRNQIVSDKFSGITNEKSLEGSTQNVKKPVNFNENIQAKVPATLPYYYGLYSPYKVANVELAKNSGDYSEIPSYFPYENGLNLNLNSGMYDPSSNAFPFIPSSNYLNTLFEQMNHSGRISSTPRINDDLKN